MKKKIIWIGLFVLGLCVFLFSCIREEWFSSPQSPNQAFTLTEAKSYYQTNIKQLKQPDLMREITCNDPSHHHLTTKSGSDIRTLTLEWNRAIQVTTERSVIINIPAKENNDQLAILIEKQKDQESNSAKVVRC
jgi:hypothetical protein